MEIFGSPHSEEKRETQNGMSGYKDLHTNRMWRDNRCEN